MTGILVRDAIEADLPAIMDIYNDAVANTTAIWNDTLVDLENRRQWLAARQARKFPVLVAVAADGAGGEAVVGYASYGDWRAFEGFRHTVEHSVYVHKEARGGGIGKLLMRELIARAASEGIRVMVACIEAENAASIRLHEAMGFRTAGVYREVGTKFGRWLDLACMELKVSG